jgi:hypothetical protein
MKLRFTLMTYGESQNSITAGFITVERDIACFALRNDELAHVMLGLATDEWMPSEDGDGLINEVQCCGVHAPAFLRCKAISIG